MDKADHRPVCLSGGGLQFIWRMGNGGRPGPPRPCTTPPPTRWPGLAADGISGQANRSLIALAIVVSHTRPDAVAPRGPAQLDDGVRLGQASRTSGVT